MEKWVQGAKTGQIFFILPVEETVKKQNALHMHRCVRMKNVEYSMWKVHKTVENFAYSLMFLIISSTVAFSDILVSSLCFISLTEYIMVE